MSTPTDPYNSPNRRAFEEGDVLAPLPDREDAARAAELSTPLPGAGHATIPPHSNDSPPVDADPARPAIDPRDVGSPSPLLAESAPSMPSGTPSMPGTTVPKAGEVAPTGMASPLYQAAPESPTAVNAPSATTATPLVDSPHSAVSTTSALSTTSAESPNEARRTAIAASVGLGGASLATPTTPTASLGPPPMPATPTEPVESTPALPGSHANENRPAAHPVESTPHQSENPENWFFASTPEPGSQPSPEPRPDSRSLAARASTWTHVGTLAATIALVPLAWYLLSDGSARLSHTMEEAWVANRTNVAAIGELIGGIAAMALIWLLARTSSIGTVSAGTVVSALGAIGILFPRWTDSTLLSGLDSAASGANDLALNVADHLRDDIGTGRLLIFGVALALTGITTRLARHRVRDPATV